MKKDSHFWALTMLFCAIVGCITGFSKIFGFGLVGENVTLNMRSKLYQAILKKDMGWFDNRDNAPGILTSVLASEVQKLNGASTEGLAVIIESTVGLICGLVLGFIFSWKLSLVALGCVPFMIFGGMMNSKL